MSNTNNPLHTIAAGESTMTVRLIRSDPSQALGALPASFWLSILVTACAACLLFAFQQVVQTSVLQAETKQQADAANAEAFWRCNYGLVAQQEHCRVQLKAARRTDSIPSTQALTGPAFVSLGIH